MYNFIFLLLQLVYLQIFISYIAAVLNHDRSFFERFTSLLNIEISAECFRISKCGLIFNTRTVRPGKKNSDKRRL